MENLELDVGGTKFKGVWLAILFSFASTIGGGIWTASEFFNRLDAQEKAVQEALAIRDEFTSLDKAVNDTLSQYQSTINTMQQQLEDNDVSGLQGNLAKLGTNLESIMSRQSELLDLRDKIFEFETVLSEQKVTIDTKVGRLSDYDKDIKVLKREIDDLWNGMDALANPLR